jgi:hypothetical protein
MPELVGKPPPECERCVYLSEYGGFSKFNTFKCYANMDKCPIKVEVLTGNLKRNRKNKWEKKRLIRIGEENEEIT